MKGEGRFERTYKEHVTGCISGSQMPVQEIARCTGEEQESSKESEVVAAEASRASSSTNREMRRRKQGGRQGPHLTGQVKKVLSKRRLVLGPQLCGVTDAVNGKETGK